MNESVIRVRELCKSYGGRQAVAGLDLDVPAGAIYALLGDNGAGKTTTIKILTGQEATDSGSATIFGVDCWAAADRLRHRVGYVPERPRFYDWMTVRETGWFVGGFHGPDFRGRYADTVARLGLDASKRLKDLSKGGYARVGLALALAIDPEVLILDEPTSGLDLMTRREFLAGMVGLAGDGRTVLICSHQIAEVERIASHVAFLKEGRLVMAGPIDEVKARFAEDSRRLEDIYAALMRPAELTGGTAR